MAQTLELKVGLFFIPYTVADNFESVVAEKRVQITFFLFVDITKWHVVKKYNTQVQNTEVYCTQLGQTW